MSYFFKPRKGEFYGQGFKGLRTLVAGVAHVCTMECEHKAECCCSEEVVGMDTQCPCYQGRDPKYYCLSNSNEIEITSFIDKEASYSAYKAFTCYMLRLHTNCPPEKRRELWESVAFTNFLQHFLADEDDEAKNQEFEMAYESFEEAVAELKPEVIFAWNPEIRNCLWKHDDAYRYLGEADMDFQLKVFVFTPIAAKLPQVEVDNLRRRYKLRLVHSEMYYRKMAKKHLKLYFKEESKDQNFNDFVRFLKKTIAEELICYEGELFAFCNTKYKWSSSDKGCFFARIKNRFGITEKYANEALDKFFNFPNGPRYPNKEKASPVLAALERIFQSI